MGKLLDTEEAKKELQELDKHWSLIDVTLVRVFEFEDFADALEFVNEIGDLAEEANHHPDIHLTYGKVEVTLTTHSEGGLTRADFKLAEQIDQI